MKNDRWATDEEKCRTLKTNAAGPVVWVNKGKTYVYDGEGHVMILGVSGSGKSRRCTIPMVRTFIKNRESGIIPDPKGEILRNVKNNIPPEYKVHVINFRELFSKATEGWNPLYAPYMLWKTGDEENRYFAEQMIEELATTMYTISQNVDPFWPKEARNVFIAAVYALFMCAKPEEVNLTSVYYLISKGEQKSGIETYLKKFVKLLSENENVAMQLESYITTANDTRAGIRSTFLDGLSIATKSESIRSFLSHDELHINELSGDQPTLIFILIPDETPIYDDLTGCLISQLMNHYIRIAEKKYSGRLPIRMNVVLEELGNIGKSITNLPHLLSAGRSRNIRVEFVLQSISQLNDLYGASNATTIISNADVKIAFRLNHWETLTELSNNCGIRECTTDGHSSKEPLITQTQLASMETGQALVIISGRVKFVTWIPDYEEIFKEDHDFYDNAHIGYNGNRPEKTPVFDIQEYVETHTKKDGNSGVRPGGISTFEEWMGSKNSKEAETHADVDIDSLIKKIDEKIEELEKEERMMSVTILNVGNRVETIKILRSVSGISLRDAKDITDEVMAGNKKDIAVPDEDTAKRVVAQLKSVGTKCRIKKHS